VRRLPKTGSHDAAPAVRLEPENEWAWCGERRLDLAPREFAVLRHLVEHAGRLVTKAELLDTVWAGTVVSEAAMTSCIRDLRRALADDARTPRYIETVHRRGFRFVGPVASVRATGGGGDAVVAAAGQRARLPARGLGHDVLVGRDAELARLRAALDAVVQTGQRRLVLVTGEAGIGKTALVESFLARLEPDRHLRIGRGQCVEQFGAGEAYLPVLDALARLGREEGGARIVETLRQHAPAWLAHLPGLLGDDELEVVQRRAQATTRERTLRQLIEAFDALAAEMPLVLVLEDLHWSDSATVEMLGMLARRQDAARLLLVATYRPAEVAASGHPLRAVTQELRLHGRCDEIALDFLGENAVGDYLARRFPASSLSPGLAHVLGRNTSGNPLFLVNVVDDLVRQGQLRDGDGGWTLTVPVEQVAATVPHSLRQMVEQQIDGLTPQERDLLAVASVAGVEFSSELAADGGASHDAEEACDRLARQGRFLRAIGAAEWPDGTVASRYAFIHAFYQNVLLARVPVGRRVGLHLRIGDRLERAHAARATEIAGELAMHFEHGRDLERAVKYRRLAADAAIRRHAHREAADHATRAIALCASLPESPSRVQDELALQMILGAALLDRGWADPDVARAYARARELCARTRHASSAEPRERFAVLSGLYGFYVTRADLAVTGELVDEMLELATSAGDAGLAIAAHHGAGIVTFYRGDFAASLAHFAHVLGGYDPARHRPHESPAFRAGQDVGVTAMLHTAWIVWLQGFPDRAATLMQDALARARALEHPYTLAFACHFAASFFQCRGEVESVRALEEAPAARSNQYGIDMVGALAGVRRGWLLAEDGDRVGGVAQYRAHGNQFGLATLLGLLAEAYGQAGRAAVGLAVLAEARDFVAASGARYWDAELKRLEGALLLLDVASASGGEERERDAEACFVAAAEVARRQGAPLLELRAVTGLAEGERRRGRGGEACALLDRLYRSFEEGFATRALREADAVRGARDAADAPGAGRRAGRRTSSP